MSKNIEWNDFTTFSGRRWCSVSSNYRQIFNLKSIDVCDFFSISYDEQTNPFKTFINGINYVHIYPTTSSTNVHFRASSKLETWFFHSKGDLKVFVKFFDKIDPERSELKTRQEIDKKCDFRDAVLNSCGISWKFYCFNVFLGVKNKQFNFQKKSVRRPPCVCSSDNSLL